RIAAIAELLRHHVAQRVAAGLELLVARLQAIERRGALHLRPDLVEMLACGGKVAVALLVRRAQQRDLRQVDRVVRALADAAQSLFKRVAVHGLARLACASASRPDPASAGRMSGALAGGGGSGSSGSLFSRM